MPSFLLPMQGLSVSGWFLTSRLDPQMRYFNANFKVFGTAQQVFDGHFRAGHAVLHLQRFESSDLLNRRDTGRHVAPLAGKSDI